MIYLHIERIIFFMFSVYKLKAMSQTTPAPKHSCRTLENRGSASQSVKLFQCQSSVNFGCHFCSVCSSKFLCNLQNNKKCGLESTTDLMGKDFLTRITTSSNSLNQGSSGKDQALFYCKLLI